MNKIHLKLSISLLLAAFSVSATEDLWGPFSREWTSLDKRQFELTLVKNGKETAMHAVLGGKAHRSNKDVDFANIPNVHESVNATQHIKYSPKFEIRLDNNAQVFVQIKNDYYQLLLESNSYGLKKSLVNKNEFNLMHQMNEEFVISERNSSFAVQRKHILSALDLKEQPKNLIKPWKTKNFKTCGLLSYQFVYNYFESFGDNSVHGQESIVFPDGSSLRIAGYSIDTIRCNSSGRVAILLASPVAHDPVYYEPSVVMLDTGIDFAAHEAKSQKN
jgi:hypothetical protein